MLKTKSYTKDTNNFLNHFDKIPATVSKNSYLVTLDVKSLYSNIPNDEGIGIVRTTLQKAGNKVTSVIEAFLWLILHFQWKTLPPTTRCSNGNKMFSIVRQPLHEQLRGNMDLQTYREEILLL